MPKSTRKQGKRAEQLARKHMQKHGLRFITKNYEKSFGEIDLVMRDKSTLVFTEVRARSEFNHGHPFETVDSAKQSRILKVAKSYLCEFGDPEHSDCRFDIVAVNLNSGRIEWLQDAFEG